MYLIDFGLNAESVLGYLLKLYIY